MDYYKLGESYSSIADKIDMHDSYYAFIVRFICDNTSTSERKHLLEAGCGNGKLAGLIARTFGSEIDSYEAFDISETMVERARQAVPKGHFSTQALPAIQTERAEYSLIIASEVLEHLAEPLASLKALRARQAENASLIITVPNADCIGFWHYLKHRKTFQPADDFHYTFPELQYLIRKAAFRIVNYAGFDGIMMPPARNRLEAFLLDLGRRLLVRYHPDINRRQKRLLLHLKKDDYLLSHDF